MNQTDERGKVVVEYYEQMIIAEDEGEDLGMKFII